MVVQTNSEMQMLLFHLRVDEVITNIEVLTISREKNEVHKMRE
jgi:hypothetical protein